MPVRGIDLILPRPVTAVELSPDPKAPAAAGSLRKRHLKT
jgi:hypothetical protein